MANINAAFYQEVLPTIKQYIEEESTVYYLTASYNYYGPDGFNVDEGKITDYRWSKNEDLQVCVDNMWMDAEEIYFVEADAIQDAKEFG